MGIGGFWEGGERGWGGVIIGGVVTDCQGAGIAPSAGYSRRCSVPQAQRDPSTHAADLVNSFSSDY